MATIRWTDEAVQWLQDIHDYVAQENTRSAQSIVTGIYQKAQVLTDFPKIGHHYRTENEGQIRVLLYGHYRIAYLIRKNSDYLDILGVFHGSLDIGRYIP